MGFCAQMLLSQVSSTVQNRVTAAGMGSGLAKIFDWELSPWVSGDEDFREAHNLGSLLGSLVDEGDGLVDTPL